MVDLSQKKIAIIVPCYNEALSIKQVVVAAKQALPQAEVWVCDNNSTDETGAIAREAGAKVVHEPKPGKGNAVRRLLRLIDADYVVMVDGDATYDLSVVKDLLEKAEDEQLDMVIGCRKPVEEAAYRSGHVWGNRWFTSLLQFFFGKGFTDILSGYRVMSRRFVRSFPCRSQGFALETEMCVHALELNAPVGEVETAYEARIEGSESKLSTYRDGFRILGMMLSLVLTEKPLFATGIGAAVCFLLAIPFYVPVLMTYFETGLVPRLPSFMLALSLTVISGIFLLVGMILYAIALNRREQKLLAYNS
ncbi:MAG: glycosyltransferase family 2 protein [Alphaproteobacteria bacterium]|nr:glycosyltransferase family 2 protein [Alphaproteobacteria bacterium]MDD9919089.1 glycosyltransferase family 2 protein [Alphaproteobacteria bacterium]